MDNVIQLPDAIAYCGFKAVLGQGADGTWLLSGDFEDEAAFDVTALLTWLRDNSPELLAAAGLAKKVERYEFVPAPPPPTSPPWTPPAPAVATVPVWTPPPLPPKPKPGIISTAPSAPNGDT